MRLSAQHARTCSVIFEQAASWRLDREGRKVLVKHGVGEELVLITRAYRRKVIIGSAAPSLQPGRAIGCSRLCVVRESYRPPLRIDGA
jgi:hypothetical protein